MACGPEAVPCADHRHLPSHRWVLEDWVSFDLPRGFVMSFPMHQRGLAGICRPPSQGRWLLYLRYVILSSCSHAPRHDRLVAAGRWQGVPARVLAPHGGGAAFRPRDLVAELPIGLIAKFRRPPGMSFGFQVGQTPGLAIRDRQSGAESAGSAEKRRFIPFPHFLHFPQCRLFDAWCLYRLIACPHIRRSTGPAC